MTFMLFYDITNMTQKRIDEIKVVDKVWAYNVEIGETELKTVTNVYVHAGDEILHLYTDEGDIDTTTNHPFYVIGKGWVAAGDLAVGDEVYNLDGTASVVFGSEIEVLDEPVLVYNLEVDDLHSYFVGCVPVLVHNYMKTSDLTQIANKLGYTKVKGAVSKGQAVYTNGKTYITYAVDSHNGGFWKMLGRVHINAQRPFGGQFFAFFRQIFLTYIQYTHYAFGKTL